MTASDNSPGRGQTPAHELERLLDGNARFAEGRAIAPYHDFTLLRALAEKQTPFAAFLGCADSRVPIEIIFDQGFGDLFPVRIAGNVVSPEVVGSLEFATQVLGARVLMVLGHSGCGAVSATLEGAAGPGQIGALYERIAPALEGAHHDLDTAIERNVQLQLRLLARSPVIAELRRAGELLLVGGVYDLASGRVRRLEDIEDIDDIGVM